jgi:DNA mismatch repair protein MutL
VSKIILLDDNTISKIAAGEVIERPASVVKELVENSIDAKAKEITIEIKDAGKKLIRVSDDGLGMDNEDAKMAVARHATSKIKDADDLFNISSLGFRGEALASIAAVSKFELLTNTSNDLTATKIVINGGKTKSIVNASRPKGTTIEVSDLFFNTPARLKFQKSKNTELTHIVDIISRFILARPDISFKLMSDDNEMISSIGSGDVLEAIASVYGSDMASTMLEVKAQGVKGFVTQPVVTKSDRNGETFIVNGRYVRNMLISRALEEAYRSLIPGNKYPIAVLSIDIDPSEVDVNVHPTKREIKLARPDIVMRMVSSAVSKALSAIKIDTQTPSISGTWRLDQDNSMPEMLRIEESTAQGQSYPNMGILNIPSGAYYQHLLTYIIYTEGNDLVMIDQHAAHERILYEKLRNKQVSGTQGLLVPHTIELPIKDFTIVSSHLEELAELGFIIEVFGRNSIMIRGIPSILTASEIESPFLDMITEIGEVFKIKSVAERQDSLYKMIACKAAIKAGDKLSVLEMDKLVKELKVTSNPTTCPHGRPAVVRMPKDRVDKMFAR